MDLPRAEGGKNVVWMIVDRWSKVARFIAVIKTRSIEELAEAYAN